MRSDHDGAARGAPWGALATLALTLAAWMALLQAGSALSAGFYFVLERFNPGQDIDALWDELFGLRFSAITCVRALLCAGLVALLVRLRNGPRLAQYIGLKPVAAATLAKWLAAVLVLVLAIDAFRYATGRPLASAYDLSLYETAHWELLFWFSLIVAAPLAEEILFRGFLFEGVRVSRLGEGGAVIVSALAWTAIHTQYGMAGLGILLALGLLCGWARWRTGSLYAPLAMHMLNNLIAGFEILITSASG